MNNATQGSTAVVVRSCPEVGEICVRGETPPGLDIVGGNSQRQLVQAGCNLQRVYVVLVVLVVLAIVIRITPLGAAPDDM
ncbi:hypothetical protein PG988_005445 [Apiospora saccharicola]